jgi:hypothetical protein
MPLDFARSLWHPVFMKTKNQRELQKHWAQQAERKAKPVKKKREDRNQAALRKAQQAAPAQE